MPHDFQSRAEGHRSNRSSSDIRPPLPIVIRLPRLGDSSGERCAVQMHYMLREMSFFCDCRIQARQRVLKTRNKPYGADLVAESASKFLSKGTGGTSGIGTAKSVTSSSSSLATSLLKAELITMARRLSNCRLLRCGRSAEEDSLTIPMAPSGAALTSATSRKHQVIQERQFLV